MKLASFECVDGTPFTTTPAELLAKRGAPPTPVVRSPIGLHEYDYGTVVFRFQDGGRLEEVTMRAPVLYLGRVDVPFAGLAAFVRLHDPQAFSRGGFLVSPAFGLAFDPDASDPWVTALARHCIETWRAL